MMQYLDVILLVSSLNGIGKSKWMKLMQNGDYKSALALLGEDVEISERVLETIETMVGELYGKNKTSITEARYVLQKNSVRSLYAFTYER